MYVALTWSVRRCHFQVYWGRTNFLKHFLFVSDFVQLPRTDMIFAISATSRLNPSENFEQMKEIINAMIYKYGTGDILHSVLVYGEQPRRVVSFKATFQTDEALMNAVSQMGRLAGASLANTLKLAKEVT